MAVQNYLFEPAIDFDKDRKDVRILVWDDDHTEHCALIENIESLIDRPKNSESKNYYCNRYTYWLTSFAKLDNHPFGQKFEQKIDCPGRETYQF